MKSGLRAAVVWTVLVLAALPVVGSAAQSSGTVTADKEGWWNRTRGTAGGTPIGGGNEPELPETVPAGAIGIAAVAGEAQKIAALGIVLDAPRGSAVSRFTLTMTEAEGTGAQQNSGDAVIAVCPVTGFFAGAENGAFQDVPEADCEAARVEGTRADDGTWTFDLLPIANVWLDPFGTINPAGIRFDPAGAGTFQVSLTGMEDAAFDVSITPAEEDPDPFDSSTTTVAGGFTGGSSDGGFATPPPPAVDAPSADPEAAPPTTTAAPVVTDEGPPAESPRESRAGDVSGNLPGGLALVLLGSLALVLVLAWHLGPAGRRPPGKIQRSGGVSRALAARSPTTGASS